MYKLVQLIGKEEEKKSSTSGNLILLVVYGENKYGTVNSSDIVHYHHKQSKTWHMSS